MAKKRSKEKYPNLVKEVNLLRRQELIDFDYLDKLNDEEKEYLNKFMGEYMGASVSKKDYVRNGVKYKRVSNKNIHSKKYHKSLYDANNARNRDIYATKSCIGGITFFDEVALDDLREKDINLDLNAFEDAIIEKDLLLNDKELYKIKIQEYIETLDNKKIDKETGLTERQETIKYLKKCGYDWVFDC